MFLFLLAVVGRAMRTQKSTHTRSLEQYTEQEIALLGLDRWQSDSGIQLFRNWPAKLEDAKGSSL